MWHSAYTGLNFSSVVGTGERIQTFCAELNTNFPSDTVVYTVTGLEDIPGQNPPGKITAAKSVLLQDLYARFYSQVNTGSTSNYSRAEFAAAFQLVVWEIVYENVTSSTDASVALGQLDVSIGGMAFRDYAGADSLSVATDMIASLGQSGFRPYSNIVELSNGSTPDMIYTYSVVPTPAVAGLAGIGLLGMRRRRRR
jgi:MYXO-CTERM domain-containing protein